LRNKIGRAEEELSLGEYREDDTWISGLRTNRIVTPLIETGNKEEESSLGGYV
jgi:hypothetical protein